LYQYSWANAGLNDVDEKTLWTLGWADKTGNQRYKSAFDLELKHSVDWFNTNLGHPLQNIIFYLHANRNMYFAAVSNLFNLFNLFNKLI
jgi:hypothetical protein